MLYGRQGQFKEALPFFERALAINEKRLGPEHHELAISLNNLAVTYGRLKMDSQAETVFQDGLYPFAKKRSARIIRWSRPAS